MHILFLTYDSDLMSLFDRLEFILFYLVLRLVYLLKLNSLLEISDAFLAGKLVQSEKVTGGLAGVVSRLKLDIIVKRPSNSTLEGRVRCRMMRTWREARFFQEEIVPSEILSIPKVYASWYNSFLGDFYICLERVDADSLKSYFGNQQDTNGPCKGKRFLKQVPMGVILSKLFERVAELHASMWREESILKLSWLKGVEWYSGRGREWYESTVAWSKSNFEAGLASRKNGLISPQLVARMEKAFLDSKFENLVRFVEDRSNPYCLLHGDFHAGNILVREDQEGSQPIFTFLDFSEIGVFDPVYDLCQMLLSDIAGEHYVSILKPTIKIWHEKVVDLLVQKYHKPNPVSEGFDFTRAYQSCLVAGIRRWMYLLAALNGFPVVSDEAIQYFATNLSLWIEIYDQEFPDDAENFEKTFFFKV